MNLEALLKQYDYKLPLQLIAQKPASPRDSARLLVCSKTNTDFRYDTFKNIVKYLPKNSVLVFNQTKVIPARLKIVKETGGHAELLYLESTNKYIKVLCNKKLPLKSNISFFDGRQKMIYMKVVNKENQTYSLKPNFPINKFISLLQKYGQTPLPPYIKNSPLSEKQKRLEYQTVFAKTGESVAAPTASLHFTKNLISHLKKQGTKIEYISLNVGLGTFAPLTEQNLKSKKLHKEFFGINKTTANRLNRYKKEGKKIIAVGTTAVRALESACKKTGSLENLHGNTEIFITPGYKFQFIDGMVTNFHVPKSSLLMLASSLMGRKKILNAYQKAISKKFRFFSFGDGMLILP